MEQLGIDKTQLQACLKMVIAQRLIRKLCPHCKQSNSVKIQIDDVHSVNEQQAKGCERCFSGFMGRTAIYEYLSQQQLEQLFLKSNKPLSNFKCLFQSGLELIDSGETTLQELYSVIGTEANY